MTQPWASELSYTVCKVSLPGHSLPGFVAQLVLVPVAQISQQSSPRINRLDFWRYLAEARLREIMERAAAAPFVWDELPISKRRVST